MFMDEPQPGKNWRRDRFGLGKTREQLKPKSLDQLDDLEIASCQVIVAMHTPEEFVLVWGESLLEDIKAGPDEAHYPTLCGFIAWDGTEEALSLIEARVQRVKGTE